MHPLKRLCHERGITQTELARQLEVDEGTVRNWFRRNTQLEEMKYKHVCGIATVLELSIDELDIELKKYIL